MPAPFNQSRQNRPNRHNQEPKEFDEKVVQVSRVSKKTKGGNKIGFSVLVVVGDRKGKVGVGLGKGPDVLSSIKKAIRRAKKRMIEVPLIKGTIPFETRIKRGAAILLLKPAPLGTGVIAGGSVRAVVEVAGVRNIVAKIIGSSNKASNVYATFAALEQIKQISDIKGIKLQKPKTQQPKTSSKTSKPTNKPGSKPNNRPGSKPNNKSAKSSPKKPSKTKTTKKS